MANVFLRKGKKLPHYESESLISYPQKKKQGYKKGYIKLICKTKKKLKHRLIPTNDKNLHIRAMLKNLII